MKLEWLASCIEFSREETDLYSGCRKILRNISLTTDLANDLSLSDCGYTKSKMAMLTRHYYNEDSINVAIKLWELRLSQAKYGSVSFTTFNHYVKGKGSVEEIIATRGLGSVFGPCIQSVVLTWVDKKTIAVDIFYRTTELFKKFPADLVFVRDVLLAPFHLPPNTEVTFHFANVTLHPMYYVVFLSHLDNAQPIYPLLDPSTIPFGGSGEFQLAQLKKADPYFFKWVVKWSAKYIVPEAFRGIDKFAQAMKIHAWAKGRFKPPVIEFLRREIGNDHSLPDISDDD